jgi:hypothetical protein
VQSAVMACGSEIIENLEKHEIINSIINLVFKKNSRFIENTSA